MFWSHWSWIWAITHYYAWSGNTVKIGAKSHEEWTIFMDDADGLGGGRLGIWFGKLLFESLLRKTDPSSVSGDLGDLICDLPMQWKREFVAVLNISQHLVKQRHAVRKFVQTEVRVPWAKRTSGHLENMVKLSYSSASLKNNRFTYCCPFSTFNKTPLGS